MKAILAPTNLFSKKLTRLNRGKKKVLTDIAKRTIVEMEKTTATWEDVDPTFIFEIDGFTVNIGPRNDDDGLIWHFLNGGTAERYAIMTPDFSPKTTPNFVGSGPGAGGFSHFSHIPTDGIDARNWTIEIEKELLPVFQKAVQKLIQEAFN